ncbi:AMP-binding protein [Microbacterium algeriense]|uniref:AMP-binding protein n=1 Tax=Microbacterium algeriense TaxID=2615184 RepID=UPI002FD7DFE8
MGGRVSKREGVTPWKELMAVGQIVSPEDLRSLKPTADSAAVVFYTSGTTGSPKGVVHSHAALIGASVPWVDRLGMSDGDAIHMTSPFGHLMGYQFGVSLPLILGGTGVFQAEWDPERFIALVDEWRVVHTSGATPFLFDLLRSLKDPTRVLSLKRFLCAGAPIPRALVEEAAHKLPMLDVLGAWGQTECGLISMCLPSDSEVKRRTTDGSALPGVKIRVQGDDGAPLPPGSRGNLHVQSPFLFREYLGDLAGTVDAFTPDGWFITGDLGTVDSDGFVRISGRAKDLIIRGGENIPVVEIEDELLQHAQIRDVAIVGVPHERLQEIAAACVVLEDPLGALRLEDVQDYLRSRGVAKNYWPEILVIRESLPRTAVGKVQKFMLRRALETAVH